MKQGEISTYILSCSIRVPFHRNLVDELGWDIGFHLQVSAGQILAERGRSKGDIRHGKSAVQISMMTFG
jgi:hypothetical protein